MAFPTAGINLLVSRKKRPCSSCEQHWKDLVFLAAWEISVAKMVSSCCHAHHSSLASCKGFFFKEPWQQWVFCPFFPPAFFFEGSLGELNVLQKKNNLHVLNSTHFICQWALVITFFLSPLRSTVKFLVHEQQSVYYCLLYMISFRRQNTVLIFGVFLGNSIVFCNLFFKKL